MARQSSATTRTTLLDVVRAAGVSRTTASFVLNGRDDLRISENARTRVLEASETLGYRRNAIAMALRTSKTRTIVLVSNAIAEDHYSGALVRRALNAAVAHEHLLLIGETGGDAETERQLIESFGDRQVDGLSKRPNDESR